MNLTVELEKLNTETEHNSIMNADIKKRLFNKFANPICI